MHVDLRSRGQLGVGMGPRRHLGEVFQQELAEDLGRGLLNRVEALCLDELPRDDSGDQPRVIIGRHVRGKSSDDANSRWRARGTSSPSIIG